MTRPRMGSSGQDSVWAGKFRGFLNLSLRASGAQLELYIVDFLLQTHFRFLTNLLRKWWFLLQIHSPVKELIIFCYRLVTAKSWQGGLAPKDLETWALFQVVQIADPDINIHHKGNLIDHFALQTEVSCRLRVEIPRDKFLGKIFKTFGWGVGCTSDFELWCNKILSKVQTMMQWTVCN